MKMRSRISKIVAAAIVVVSVGGYAAVTAAENGPEPTGRAAGSATAAPSFIDGNLQYFTVAPCRVFDSRNSTDGAYTGGEQRTLFVMGLGNFEDFPGQGGNPEGCDIPLSDGTAAVMINITAVSANRPGFVRAWPNDGSGEPNATILNFSPALNASNGIAVPLAAQSNGDIVVRVRGASAHLVGDVVGYFAQPDPMG